MYNLFTRSMMYVVRFLSMPCNFDLKIVMQNIGTDSKFVIMIENNKQ